MANVPAPPANVGVQPVGSQPAFGLAAEAGAVGAVGVGGAASAYGPTGGPGGLGPATAAGAGAGMPMAQGFGLAAETQASAAPVTQAGGFGLAAETQQGAAAAAGPQAGGFGLAAEVQQVPPAGLPPLAPQTAPVNTAAQPMQPMQPMQAPQPMPAATGNLDAAAQAQARPASFFARASAAARGAQANRPPRIVRTSVALEIFLYFGAWFDVVYCVLTLLVFIYKGTQLPYPSDVYGTEVRLPSGRGGKADPSLH